MHGLCTGCARVVQTLFAAFQPVYMAAMPQRFDTLAAVLDHGFDSLIDVRSPAEFAEDHIPGAVSLPVLSDAERARVGTIYTQESPFRARKIGAALVARNAATHIEGPLADHDGSWRPLVYCWRGGQRSGSFSSILQQIGWRAETVDGGYQSYRRLVNDLLYEAELPSRVILLDGNTGTAKTDLLARLSQRGVQTIDLEGLANHRGSVLGALPGGQPSQKAFESRLAAALCRLDPARPLVVEAESNKVGQRVIPPSLWHPMRTAPRLTVKAPLDARAEYLGTAYADMIDNPEELAARMAPLHRLRGRKAVARWDNLLKSRDFTGLARALMAEHYDPAYARSRRDDVHEDLAEFRSDTLDAAARDRLADRIAAHLSQS